MAWSRWTRLFVAPVGALSLLAGCYDSHSIFGASPRRDGGGPLPGIDGGGPLPGTDGGGPIPTTDGGGPIPGMDGGGPIPGTDGGGPIPGRDAGPRADAGPPPDAGPPSIALRFQPMDRLVVASAPGLDLTGAFTLEMWIRPRDPGPGTISLKGVRETRRYQYGVAMDGGDVVVGWGANDAVHELRAPVPIGEWTHVAMVFSGGDRDVARMRLVVNGAVAAEGSFPNDVLESVNDQPLVFGLGYEGDIDEIRLWRIARLAPGIRATMRTRISGSVPGLQAYWPLEESGQLALDRTLHGHDAVLGRRTRPDGADPEWIRTGPI